jgi:predicted CXXCH cytochrome family protein
MKLHLTRISRNTAGRVSRNQETLQADTILIGRGSDCRLHLADPRVALNHARLQLGDTGHFAIEAIDGTLVIDDRIQAASILKPAQRILIGPYVLEICPMVANELAVTLELLTPLAATTDATGRRNAALSLAETWLSKRAMSWVAAVSVLGMFLIWPIQHALKNTVRAHPSASDQQNSSAHAALPHYTADASWSPGALDSAHASFGRDCQACHQTPFVQVQNDACEACHRTTGWHFDRTTDEKRRLHRAVFGDGQALAGHAGQAGDGGEGRCAACHRDHKGVNALKRQDSPLCTDCHRDLKQRHAGIGVENASDFATDHPPFKLSMLVPGQAGKTNIVRVTQDGKTAIVERSNLKFPHDVHLAKKGIRGVNGTQQLECKNCHLPDETGTRFKAVTMREHCQACHSLEFEPKASKRQVPHGSIEDVIATVSEFYAQAALLGTPIDVSTNTAGGPPVRPGAAGAVGIGSRSAGESGIGIHTRSGPPKNLAWVNAKAQATITEMMEKRTCFACHEISRSNQSWHIQPIAVTQHWLTKIRFPHSQHITYECQQCHDVAESKSSQDVAIPDINNCRSCHAGNQIRIDRAPGTCQTCHDFHIGTVKAIKPITPSSLPKSVAQR